MVHAKVVGKRPDNGCTKLGLIITQSFTLVTLSKTCVIALVNLREWFWIFYIH